MENTANVSSEQELLQLRDEGKISEAEYNDLLDVMKKPPESATHTPELQSDKAKPKRRLGKISFYTMLTGIILPIVCFFVCFAIAGWGEGDVIFSACLTLCVIIEIPAFVSGWIAWPDPFGKATALTSSLILGGILLYILYNTARVVPVTN